ncbi:MAG: hypothetical protein K0U66_04000, partial [Gammaproteobacteria bacterium]|nr:hypothetical protein [Gammaproteobacteria bacterium]
MLILTACGGAAAPTEDITRLEGELQTARTALATAETAQETAETAQETAERLQKEAETAQAEAERLQREALSATTIANTERGNAITARDNALKAQMDAETAQGLAEKAQMDAETAKGLAEQAQADAETDKATAEKLQMDAETAQGLAETAQATAEGLRDDAVTAQGIAETAKGVAETAQGVAETARMNAETARDTAISERNTARSQRDTFETNLNAEKRETTRLNQFIRPTYATWELFVNPELNPNTTPQNQFLQTDRAVISIAGTTAVPNDIQTLNLATTSFDGLALGGEGDDGVAFFRGGIYNYAGVFEGTDLGMPLTDTTGSAVWNGSFDHILSAKRDFTLHITFDTNGGTLDAFVHAGLDASPHNNFIFDNARFDTRGLITGRVIYGTFAYNNPAATPSATRTATLRGLIGQQGAVGAFVGEVGQDIGGAFVAHPTAALDPNIINFADWAGAVGNPKATVLNSAGTGTEPFLSGVSSVDDTNPNPNFLQGLATLNDKGFDFAGTDFSVANVGGDVLLLATDSPSGVAFSNVFGTGVTGNKYYAGLLPGTNLGAPITINNTSAIWNAGLMFASNRVVSINPNFKMKVTFIDGEGIINSGTESGAFTAGEVTTTPLNLNKNINIQGRFGRDGLLYGTVDVASTAGTLTGLIGLDGAVGAFVGDGYAGGFVAHPTATFENVVVAPPPSPPLVVFAQWAGLPGEPKTTAGTGTVPLLNGVASVGNSNPNANFIQGLATVDGKGFNFAGTALPLATVEGDVLLLAENSPSGLAYSAVYGTGVTDIRAYAGLLPGTNLGAPITDPSTSAIWDAEFMAVLRRGRGT